MKKKNVLFVIMILVCVLCIALASGISSNLTGSMISYTNSQLVSYTCLSPNNRGQRTHAIDTITIHTAVGQCSVERMGEIYAPRSRNQAFNYGVGVDGRIGLYVEEKNCPISTPSNDNDQRAINIVVASDTTEPYAVNNIAYNNLIKLVAEICKRNGIKKLVWSTDKSKRVDHLDGCNMTVHRDFANRSCPGKFLYDRMGDIAAKVNTIIASGSNVSNAVGYDDFSEGEIVNFKGNYFYNSATGNIKIERNASKVIIKIKYESAIHPIYVIAVDDDGNEIDGVEGWCNLEDIEKLNN